MKAKNIILTLFLAVAMCLSVNGAWAEEVRGVTDTEIKIGVLTDFSGPGKIAGPPIADCFKHYMAHINDQGGVHGRKIKVIIEDNGIFPNTTIKAARKIIFKDEVFAIGFNLGSAGTAAIVPLVEENKVVMLPYGANKKFYDPGNKWVFVPHTTQFDLACRAVDYILDTAPKAKIGVIYQDDAYGREGLDGARATVEHRNSKIVAQAPYKLGTVDLAPQMKAMKEANVDFIVIWSYLPQAAAALKIKAKMGWDVPMIGSKPTYTPVIFALVGDLAEGYLIATDNVPLYMKKFPGVKKVWELNAKYGNPQETLLNPKYAFPIYNSAYNHAIALVEGLNRAGKNLTPEGLIKSMESIKDLDMGGSSANITFGPKRHVGMFSSVVLKANAKAKRYEIVAPFKEPSSPHWKKFK